MKYTLSAVLLITCAFSAVAEAADSGVIVRGPYSNRADVSAFLQRFSSHNDYSLNDARKIIAQGKKLQRVIDLMKKPAEGKPWYQYRKIFVTSSRSKKGVEFWQQNKEALKRAEAEYGVPAEIIVAIIGIETNYGKNMGGFNVLDTLVTLGFDYPKRSKFFLDELGHYLMLCKEEQLDIFKLQGSYAGAMGYGQFISSSYRKYSTDFDGNGHRDLFNVTDAIGSVASYFKAHGWQTGESVVEKASAKGKSYLSLDTNKLKPGYSAGTLKKVGIKISGTVSDTEPLSIIVLESKKNKKSLWVGHRNFYVISRYNHSKKYAMAVYQLSQAIRKRYPK